MNKIVSLPKMTDAASMPAQGNESRRTYSGGMTDEDLKRPGSKLIAMLLEAAATRGILLKDLAPAYLDVSYTYIHQLRTGGKETPNVSDAFLRRCAEFLGVPRLSVMMAAGKLTAEDCLPPGSTILADIRKGIQYMLDDPFDGAYLSPLMLDLPADTQYVLVRNFEKAKGVQILAPHVSIEAILKELTQSHAAAANDAKAAVVAA